ncbi:MAG: hypothetical protein QXL15_00505, partial [Candidatus Korarchaeota archaeon]
AFLLIRRHSRKHPLQIKAGEVKEETKEKLLKDKWEKIGMHRQIGGFLSMFFMALILIIPIIILSTAIIPRFIVPFPQAMGWYSWTTNFFQFVWIAFDMGTSVALAKFFAQYRVKEPHIAIRYAQIFVWWQMLTGIAQLVLIAILTTFLFESTLLSYLTWVFMLHSMVQYPGFFLVFMYIFQGMQRLDLYNIINLAYYQIMPLIGQILFIPVFRAIGAANPVFGEAMGAAIGNAVGQYFSEWLIFFSTLLMFKKMGFSPLRIFRVDFTSNELKKVLSFGGKWTAGEVWVPLVWFESVTLLSLYLPNYAAWTGYYNIAMSLGQLVYGVSLFLGGLMSGLSEAHSFKKNELVKYYIIDALKWSNLLAFWMVGTLWIVGWRFILGAAGVTWAPAATLMSLVLIFQVLGPYSWEGDQIFSGTGHTGYAAIAWIVEQGIRAVLLFVFLTPFIFGSVPFGIAGILLAYIPALTTKNIVVWSIVYKKISKPPRYLWQTFIAPALSAFANMAVLEIISWMIWGGPNDLLSSMVLFIIGIFFSLFIFMFFSGLFGGWDDGTLEELKEATETTTVMKGLAKLMYKCISIGARISPLHGKYPMKIRDIAVKEAIELTKEKTELVI